MSEMSDVDVDPWILYDGPEPERLRPVLDALRDEPPLTSEDMERATRALYAQIDAMFGPALPEEEAAGPSPEPAAHLPYRPPVALPPEPLPLAPPAPPPDAPARPPRPAEALASTADLCSDDFQDGGKLPFGPPGPPAPSPVKRASKTLDSEKERHGLGETLPLGENGLARAMATVPFEGSAIGMGIVPIPDLTLSEFTSLCSELEVPQHPVETILRRYKVASKASLLALHVHWQQHFAEHPEDGAKFEKDFATFTGYLRELPK
jgi:hypothetical protein